jgi:citrate lyase subunit alpha/citrate CoA-transferase
MAPKIINSLDELYQIIPISKYPNISFHHHLRNGDYVMNMVLDHYIKHKVKRLHLYPSSIFPVHTKLLKLLHNGQVESITTNYMNGPVAQYLSQHPIHGGIRMQTHGGRARNILDGTSHIDIAYIAAPFVDMLGNATGYLGKSKFGSIGYAIPDSEQADITVLITDDLTKNEIANPEILGKNVDYIVLVDQIGDPNGIVSGTTNITTHPIHVKIARDTVKLMNELGLISQGFTFQSGAGGTSLRVTKELGEIMRQRQIHASFFSGGITEHHVALLEEGLVEYLYDVQCFDKVAIQSIARNQKHIPISANLYANPVNKQRIIKDLDVVILGATEIDLNFNVNVTTDSHGKIIGGSGGHSDTASEAKVSIIVAPLLRGRLPLIKQNVTTITTLGKNIDALVTERGIAINPSRTDLLTKLKHSKLPLKPIDELLNIAHKMTGIPKPIPRQDTVIGVIEDRTQTIIDTLKLVVN